MKKGSKKIALLLSAALLAGTLFGCENEQESSQKGIELVNFTNVTAEGTLGENFSLNDYLTVRDTDSNAYKATVSVKDSAGAEVEVSSNRFRIKQFSAYTVTLTYEIAENDIRTRTVTVNVVDKGAPQILVTLPAATVGEEYAVPTPTVTDASGEELTASVKVYAGIGEEKTEIELTEGKFTPTARGKYTYEATATDSSGNVGTTTKVFKAFTKGELSPLAVFEDEASLSRMATDTYVNIGKSFISEADIAKDSTLPALPAGEGGGYLKLDCTGNKSDGEGNHWLSVRFPEPECGLQDFLNGDYVELTAYVTNTANPDSTSVRVMYRNAQITTIGYNEWQTVQIPLSTFYRTASSTQPADITALYNSLKSVAFFNFNTGNVAHDILEPVYISSVRLIQKERDVASGDALAVIDKDSYTETLAIVNPNDYEISWDETENAVKVEPTVAWGTTTPPSAWLALTLPKLSKNFSELNAYSKVRFVVKSEVDKAPWIKHKITGSGDAVKTEFTVTEVTEGADAGWKYMEMDMATFIKYFYFVEKSERVFTWEGNLQNFNYDSATGIYTGEYLGNWWIRAITLVK